MALVIIGVALTLTTYAALSASSTLGTTGTVTTSANLGVYSDSTCSTPITTIYWGSPAPGGTVTQTVYIKNTSNGLSLTLNMTTSNWNPTTANGPIAISWNQQGVNLQPGQVVTATLTLTVSSTISDITSFTVNINIGGTNP